MALFVDPEHRLIGEIDLRPTSPPLARVPGFGTIYGEVANPLRQDGIFPVYIDPMGVFTRTVTITDPEITVDELAQRTRWIAVLMVINGATCIIPTERMT